MKKNFSFVALILLTAGLSLTIHAQDKKQDFYQIRIYHFSDSTQENTLDRYLSKAWLPAAHKVNFKNIGIFKPIANDTSTDKRLIVFISSSSLEKIIDLDAKLEKDSQYREAAKEFADAVYDKPSFSRVENILLQAFPLAPKVTMPGLKGERGQRVYELRSYEGPTVKLFQNKVRMFNEGGEIVLFKRLDFNAVFYASVISGSRMPNLMYMTSFENMTQRDEHWKTFRDDPEWKRLSSLPEYQHNVSKVDITFLRATDYSDL